jgi:TfoX/Sxy family transcriptional regulator of competence genes
LKVDIHPLFYREKGNLIRNYYCSECLCGPFLKEDIKKGLLVELGGERQTIRYCRKCYNTKRISTTVELLVLSSDDLEREKYIVSGKALEDLRNNISRKYSKKSEIKEVSVIKEKDTTIAPVEELPEAISDNTPVNILEDDVLPSIEEPEEIIKDIIDDASEKEIAYDFKENLKQGNINFLMMSAQDIIDLVKKKTGISILTPLKHKRLIISHAQKIFGDKILYNKSVTPTVAPISVQAETEIKQNCVDIINLSAKGIVDLVKEKTGQSITTPLKSKKTITRQARKLLEEKGFSVQCEVKSGIEQKQIEIPAFVQIESNQNKIDIQNLSAKDIVDLVKEKTDQDITLSLKSKKSIIRRAERILTEKGFSI